MAIDNICYVLNNFLNNNNFDYIIFSWVLHKQEDHDIIISSLRNQNMNFELYDISLIANEDTLKERLKERMFSKAMDFNVVFDEENLLKTLKGSLNKMNQIINLNTIKLDVSNKNKQQVLESVLAIVGIDYSKKNIYIKH